MTPAEQRRYVRDLVRNVTRDLIAESHAWPAGSGARDLAPLVAARFARVAARRESTATAPAHAYPAG